MSRFFSSINHSEGNEFDRINNFQKKIGNRHEENQLKQLAEKFVTYFSGTFQCNVGHQVIFLFRIEYLLQDSMKDY